MEITLSRIKEAAICLDGKVWTGHRHGDVIQKMVKEGCTKIRESKQGFVTEDGKFVNREEAFEIALACGQIKETEVGGQRTLVSEDLY